MAQKEVFVCFDFAACMVDTVVLLPAIRELQYLDYFGYRGSFTGRHFIVGMACEIA